MERRGRGQRFRHPTDTQTGAFSVFKLVNSFSACWSAALPLDSMPQNSELLPCLWTRCPRTPSCWTPRLFELWTSGLRPRPCPAVWASAVGLQQACEILRASELHTTAASTPPRPRAAVCLASAVCGLKNRWRGGEIPEEECPLDFSAFSCFSSTLKSWFVGYSFFVRLMLFVRSSAGALWRYPGRGCKRFSFWFFINLTSCFSLIVKSINWLFLYMIIRSQMLKFFCCLVFLLFPLFLLFLFFLQYLQFWHFTILTYCNNIYILIPPRYEALW